MYTFPGLKWIENHASQIRPLLFLEKYHHLALHLMTGDLSDTTLLFPRYGAVNKNTKAGAHYAKDRCFTILLYTFLVKLLKYALGREVLKLS